jgi:lantibiotic modifying enzyme
MVKACFHRRLDVCEHQLNRCIEMFLDSSDFYSSATLAGAAEEVLGKMLEYSGSESSSTRRANALLSSLTPQEIEALKDSVEQKNIPTARRILNEYRNWLKHFMPELDEFFIDAESAAAELIERAVENFYQVSGRDTPQTERFLEYQRNRNS